ncbi:polysaccharide deacetylase family protein [Streptomyces candidus]|uniref:Peptidoglycan/xylan/chitin deacetylase (PgdA/CDA1 family) n=1 Tax=Streptomyces candidus TaxID=67283 RepID=A0A7X0LPE9_9ACTN|nr:polysaccharide deacetylase family protein [Streptomyces candidus]MBB6435900.1 peptidoglycan/xylan/chitin deacetylase (PgdA/CDA1 family) [Streptomyces candidus]GHH42892.1 xylanase [Streptomyces candidus]
MRHRLRPLCALTGAALLATGCSSGAPPAAVERPAAASPAAASPAAAGNPAELGVNELGQVPVLMYHQLTEKPASVYDRTPADFRAELERLAREKYVPVTARDFQEGRIATPAGTHPVVLTFDDSTNSQVRLGPDGAPAPNTAVAILAETARKYPGFKPVATFFVNADAFSATGPDKALAWLKKQGHEIGNHTDQHQNLRSLDAAGAAGAIAAGQRAIEKAAPGTSVTSLALPFGAMPEPAGVAAQGEGYRYSGVYLVGSNPSLSPFAKEFAPAAIPRIRSAGPKDEDAELGSARWLDRLAAQKSWYVSDGDPRTVAFPRAARDKLAPAFAGQARPY